MRLTLLIALLATLVGCESSSTLLPVPGPRRPVRLAAPLHKPKTAGLFEFNTRRPLPRAAKPQQPTPAAAIAPTPAPAPKPRPVIVVTPSPTPPPKPKPVVSTIIPALRPKPVVVKPKAVVVVKPKPVPPKAAKKAKPQKKKEPAKKADEQPDEPTLREAQEDYFKYFGK